MNSGNRAGRMDSRSRQSRPGIRWSLRRGPRKGLALRWEGPKRGARELVRIIGRPWSLVNTDTVRKYPALTVGKADGARITIRKKSAYQITRIPSAATRTSGWSDVQLRNIDVAEFDRRWQLVFVQLLEELQDVSDAGQVDRVLPGQLLNGLEFHDVALRKPTAVGRGAPRHHQPEVFVHHERPRMGLQDLRRHADGVNRFVQGDVGVASGFTFDGDSHAALQD